MKTLGYTKIKAEYVYALKSKPVEQFCEKMRYTLLTKNNNMKIFIADITAVNRQYYAKWGNRYE